MQATYADLLISYWLVHADLGHHSPLMGDPRNAWMSGTFERVPEDAGKDASADQPAAVCCQTASASVISLHHPAVHALSRAQRHMGGLPVHQQSTFMVYQGKDLCINPFLLARKQDRRIQKI